jgi:hypothetical protein
MPIEQADKFLVMQIHFETIERAEVALMNVCAFDTSYNDVLRRLLAHKKALTQAYSELMARERGGSSDAD